MQAASAATPFLRLFGFVILAYMWQKLATAAKREIEQGKTGILFTSKVKSIDFYFSQMLPEVKVLLHTIKHGKTTIMQFDESEL